MSDTGWGLAPKDIGWGVDAPEGGAASDPNWD